MISKRSLIFFAALAAVMLSAGSTALAQNVQVAHAAPFADTSEDTAVTVLVNGNLILQDFRFGEVASLSAGGAPEIQVDVVPAGADDPVISETVALGEDVTILAVGDGVKQDLGLIRLSDTAEAPSSGTVNLRVLHAASFADEIDDTEVAVRTAGGAELAEPLNSLRFREDSGFLPVGAGVVDVKVTSPDGLTNLIDPLPVDLPDGANLTVVAIGNGDQQPLGVLALPGIGQLQTRAPVDNSVNGWWESVNTGNEGVVLQPLPAENRLIGTIYTYENGEPRWFTFDSCSPEDDSGSECPTPGAFDGINAAGSVFEFTGGEFNGMENAERNDAGVFEFEFTGCRSGNVMISLDDRDPVEWEIRLLAANTSCTLDETLSNDEGSTAQ